nr:TonB-dependent siderophore receptor [Acinetobacter larvae]
MSIISPMAFAEDQNTSDVQDLPVIQLHADNGEQTEATGSYKAKASRSATRLNLSLKETPQSVSVVTHEQMQQRNLNDISKVLDATPGIVGGRLDTQRHEYKARGYGIGNYQINGMPIGENAPLSDTFFYDRVEVIKGASGLMGATGDPSATINMIRKKPSKMLTGEAAVSLSRWDTIRSEVDVSVPLTQDGRVRSRVMAMHEQGDTYIDYYRKNSDAAMAVIEADFTANLVGSIGLQYQNNKPKGSTWGAVPYWNAKGEHIDTPRSFSFANSWNTIRESDRTVFTDLAYNFDNGWLLKASSSYSWSKSFWLMSYGGSGFAKDDGTGIGLWNTVFPNSESKKLNAEIYASGPFKLFNREHELVIGANGFSRKSESISGRLTNLDFGDQATCNSNGACTINDWRTWDGHATSKPDYEITNRGKDSKQQNYGAYATLRLNITDPLKVILGGRYSEYKATNGNKADVTADKFTPFVGLTYALTDQLTAYASYSDMFKPSDKKDRNSSYLEPETGKNYELGLKAGWFDDRLLSTAAVFRSEKENVAVRDKEAIDLGMKTDDGGDPMMSSGEGLTVTGFELETIGQITPTWNITAGYTYLGVDGTEIAKADNEIPRNLVKLYTNYQLPNALFDGAEKFNVGFGGTWQSEIKNKWGGAPANSVGDGYIKQKAYMLANANIGYRYNENFSANLSVNNLFDKKYYEKVGFYNGIFWGEPRNVTLTLRAHF